VAEASRKDFGEMGEFSKGYDPKRGDPVHAGKRNGRRTTMTDALMMALNREVDSIKDGDGKPTKRLNVIANQLAIKASDGDIQAIKEVFDRTDGKAVQMIMGDPDSPLAFMFDVNLIKPD